jgi:hypothetical protein
MYAYIYFHEFSVNLMKTLCYFMQLVLNVTIFIKSIYVLLFNLDYIIVQFACNIYGNVTGRSFKKKLKNLKISQYRTNYII